MEPAASRSAEIAAGQLAAFAEIDAATDRVPRLREVARLLYAAFVELALLIDAMEGGDRAAVEPVPEAPPRNPARPAVRHVRRGAERPLP